MTANPEQELRLYRFLDGLYSRLGGGRDADQVARSALRETVSFLGASAGCLATVPPGETRARVTFGVPPEAGWDLDLLAAFYRDERPEIPHNVLLAPLSRRRRKWRVLALRSDDPVDREVTGSLLRIAGAISELLQRIDRDRIQEVRSRIEQRIMEQLRPKDLFYQILHGLRTLTGYDHSSALLISGEQGDALEVVAEQITWRKGRSERIGLRLTLDERLERLTQAGQVYGFERHDGVWRDWTDRDASALASLLDYNRGDDDGIREVSMLCAPLTTRDGVVGMLKVASRTAGSLGAYEAETLRRFMPQASVAIQNSRRNETLEAKMLQAERRSAVAEVARGVAHDVNNALGAILPLVQQLREDGRAGTIDPETLATDLQEIEDSVQLCRRIFGGMLAFARGAAHSGGHGDVKRAIEGALAILKDGMRRRRIRCDVDVPAELPELPGNQGDLEQVFFNLFANARDAMPEGGRLKVKAREVEGAVEIMIEDSGRGISEEDLGRIFEPFYTTKSRGNGLGLSICRSIVWGMQGKFDVESRPGEGTRVKLKLPVRAGVAVEDE